LGDTNHPELRIGRREGYAPDSYLVIDDERLESSKSSQLAKFNQPPHPTDLEFSQPRERNLCNTLTPTEKELEPL
jgi:hypothetical protein